MFKCQFRECFIGIGQRYLKPSILLYFLFCGFIAENIRIPSASAYVKGEEREEHYEGRPKQPGIFVATPKPKTIKQIHKQSKINSFFLVAPNNNNNISVSSHPLPTPQRLFNDSDNEKSVTENVQPLNKVDAMPVEKTETEIHDDINVVTIQTPTSVSVDLITEIPISDRRDEFLEPLNEIIEPSMNVEEPKDNQEPANPQPIQDTIVVADESIPQINITDKSENIDLESQDSSEKLLPTVQLTNFSREKNDYQEGLHLFSSDEGQIENVERKWSRKDKSPLQSETLLLTTNTTIVSQKPLIHQPLIISQTSDSDSDSDIESGDETYGDLLFLVNSNKDEDSHKKTNSYTAGPKGKQFFDKIPSSSFASQEFWKQTPNGTKSTGAVKANKSYRSSQSWHSNTAFTSKVKHTKKIANFTYNAKANNKIFSRKDAALQAAQDDQLMFDRPHLHSSRMQPTNKLQTTTPKGKLAGAEEYVQHNRWSKIALDPKDESGEEEDFAESNSDAESEEVSESDSSDDDANSSVVTSHWHLRNKKRRPEEPRSSEIENNEEETLDKLLYLIKDDGAISSHEASDSDTREDEGNLSSDDENSRVDVPQKRSKKGQAKATSLAEVKGVDEFLLRQNKTSTTNIDPKDDSDDESDEEDRDVRENPHVRMKPYRMRFPGFPQKIIDMGVRLKFLANVYLRKVDKTANIFLPYYTMEVVGADGSINLETDFFRTSKKEICVFASGGLQNVWEKTVGNVYQSFFNDKIKIIRAYWIQKHLFKDKKIRKDLEEDFKGKESELHSEFYYDLFFKHFFMDDLYERNKKVKNLAIQGFSWWDVCNGCEKYLTGHKNNLLDKGINVSYEIVASRRYAHHYPTNTGVEGAYVPVNGGIEDKVWNEIWQSVLKYVGKKFDNGKDKKAFWTKTKEGLEVCKWLGQAFVENVVASPTKGGKSKAQKKGDVLKHYAATQPLEIKALNGLLSYLRDKNWELSCWYKPPYYSIPVQKKWKTNWRQIVIPHFGWQLVYSEEDVDMAAECEMCGYQDLHNVYLVYHPKFRVSKRLLTATNQANGMGFSQYTREPSALNLPPILQQKRKQSLCVGSECYSHLRLSMPELKLQQQHSLEEQQLKWLELAKKDDQEAMLEEEDNAIMEKEAKRRTKKKR